VPVGQLDGGLSDGEYGNCGNELGFRSFPAGWRVPM
jgi:hypothetical protein